MLITAHARFAYVEFADASIVQNALVLNDSTFRSRLLSVSICTTHELADIQVKEKRTNIPGMNRGRGRGRGRAQRGYHPYRGGRSRYV